MPGRCVVNTSPLQYLFRINQVVGTIGVLAMAKEQRLIPAVKPLIADLIAAGFWLSTRVQRDILEMAGE